MRDADGMGLFRYEGQVNHSGTRREEWHGRGVFSTWDGGRYEGEVRKSLPNGHGTKTDTDGSVQSGQFKDGIFQG